MTRHLFIISIGSVQDFISAARRTRDLWFGSYLLSEISRAAAKAIADEGGKLIFPALEKESKDLMPSYSLPNEERIRAFNVANNVLAELPDSIDDPSKVNEKARRAARDLWLHYANETREDIEGIDKKAINLAIWKEQVIDADEWTFDVIPIYSAWIPLGPHYINDRKHLMRLLSGRKMIRDFKSPAGLHPMIPKSSLDGARESVLTKDKKIRKKLSLRLRLGKGEQLCAVALTKRLGEGKVPFPSVVRVAADPWIRGVLSASDEAKRLLDEIGTQCKGENGFSSGTGYLYKDKFGYDGQILYPPRLSKFLGQKSNSKGTMDSDAYEDNLSEKDFEKLNEIKCKINQIQKICKKCSMPDEPDPYLAILIADGDRMGNTINLINTAEYHREFSKNLSKFANAARNIVESNNGVLVYSGGDDVLAFLPVDKCLLAARDLHEEFGKTKLLRAESGESHGGLTLSVGIAIAHAFEPMEDLIKYAKIAEKDAKKPNRNGLAVHLHKRNGGDPICLREQWRGDDRSLDRKLERWANMHLKNALPDKAAYEIRELAEVYRNWKGTSEEDLEKLITADAARMLKRKRPDGTEDKKISLNDLDFMLADLDSYNRIMQLADELILARKLAEVMKQAVRCNKNQENGL